MTFIAEAGQDRYEHVFGGDAWKLVVPSVSAPAPAVILTLDSADERLGLRWPTGQLPLASRLDAASTVVGAPSIDPKALGPIDPALDPRWRG